MINDNQYLKLLEWMKHLGNAAVAFSGGVDSTLVLTAARDSLHENVLAFTVKTPYIPEWEVKEAVLFCKERGIRHQVIHKDMPDEIGKNPENRCYLCKKQLFTMLKAEALRQGFDHILDGTNADDSGTYRPGLAALKELGIKSPLFETGINKLKVRQRSVSMGLPTADKPSYACLLTRMPYNYEVRNDELERIEKAEVFLASLGFRNSRVRNHKNIARIETDREKMQDFTQDAVILKVTSYFHDIGYEFVTLDLDGYRSGSYDKKFK